MLYDRKKYEKLILDSPLFSLRKEIASSAFKRESYRMVEYLYCYLMSINQRDYEIYGCEITETAIRCIRNYDERKGEFLHYFNAAWKKEYWRISREKQLEDKYRGIRIAEDDKKAVRRYIQFAERVSLNCKGDDLYKKLSDAMGEPIERIVELAILSNLNIYGDSLDSTMQNLWNRIPAEESVVQKLETTEEIEEIFTRIERAFRSLQTRQKPIVSDLITVKIHAFLTKKQAEKFSFVSRSIMREWSQYGTMPTQRDIAKKYGRDEASISRTLNNFLSKLKKEGQ